MSFLSTFLAKSSFRIGSRFISTTSTYFNEKSENTQTKELEELFFSDNNDEKTNIENSSNKDHNRKKFSIGINRVELLGGVAADPEYLVSKKGDNFSTFRLFTNIDYRRRDGKFSEQVEVHDIHIFNTGLINYLKKYVKKGSRVYVCGRLHYITRGDGSRKSLIRGEIIQSIAKNNEKVE